MRPILLLLVLLIPLSAGALPPRLRDTGHEADGRIAFAPQYPLWSDGAAKRRWIWLPPGTQIDAADADAWDFPRGTRLFKEFSLAGRRIETRVIERRADGEWDFGVYVWNEDGSEAQLAPPAGMSLPVSAAPGGRYTIPSLYDCQACHGGPRVPVLGFSALQLSADRDPLAPHAEHAPALDLGELVRRGLLRNLPPSVLAYPPRIQARSPAERAALGYLHGNCGHCHDAGSDGAVPVDLRLAQHIGGSDDVLRTLLEARSRFRSPAGTDALVVPGRPGHSLLPLRMRSRDPRVQMPPLGTALPDSDALALLGRWIDGLPISTHSTHHQQGE